MYIIGTVKCSFIFLFLTFCFQAKAQNPLVYDIYTADPTARVFNDTLFIYPSHDSSECSITQGDNGFCMPDYFMYSTTDLVNYKNHGMILSHNSVPWVKTNSYGMWAPDCVEKDGKYYFFFPATPVDDSAFRKIGVAIANSPTGPFKPKPKYIKNISGIDPGILVDNGTSGYIFFAQKGKIKGAKLGGDFNSITGSIITFDQLPNGYKEGPFPFKRNATYYLTFAHVGKKGYEIGYATAEKPLGPYTYVGTIMPNIGPGTNHHSIVQYKGKWYLFYHHWSISNNSRLRSMRADEITFDENGEINTKVATNRGIGTPKENDIIQLDRSDDLKHFSIIINSKGSDQLGWSLETLADKGSVIFERVDFNGNTKQFFARVAGNTNEGKLVLRLDNEKGRILAVFDLKKLKTKDLLTFQTISSKSKIKSSGVHDLYLSYDIKAGKKLRINWVSFSNDDQVPNPPLINSLKPKLDPTPPFGKKIQIIAFNKKFLTANEEGNLIRASRNTATSDNTFEVLKIDDDHIALKHLKSNKFLSFHTNIDGNPLHLNTTLGAQEKFEYRSVGIKKFAIKASNGNWVSARLSEPPLTPLKANKKGEPLQWETFYFIEPDN